MEARTLLGYQRAKYKVGDNVIVQLQPNSYKIGAVTLRFFNIHCCDWAYVIELSPLALRCTINEKRIIPSHYVQNENGEWSNPR